jgi:hypothetical protein
LVETSEGLRVSTANTIGEALNLALARAHAELEACRDALNRPADQSPDHYDSLAAFDDHMIEALDAVLIASGVPGVWRTSHILQEAARRHGFRIVGEVGNEP